MKYFSLLILTLLMLDARATHFMAGEMYYDYLGSNNYQFNLIFYRNSDLGTAAFDVSVHFSVYNQSGTLLQNVTDSFPGSDQVFQVPFASVYDVSCVSGLADTSIEYTIYTAVINLPPIVGGYTVSYQRCCMAANAVNVSDSGDNGFTLTCHVPGLETGEYANSSPRFPNHSPFVVCNNLLTSFDHSAIDPDGDDLNYFVSAAISGASSITPNPTTALPPPYNPIGWMPGYSTVNVFGVGSVLAIDSLSGELSILPQEAARYVFALKVQEVRAGAVLGETIRNMIVHVVEEPNTSLVSEINLNQTRIFPNPSEGQFEIISSGQVSQVRIYSVTGELIQVPTETTEVDLRSIPAGLYFIELTIGDQVKVEKIQKL